jgi:hypothetical protein
MYIVEVLLVKTNIKYLIYSAMKKDKCFQGVVYTRDFVTCYSNSVIFTIVTQSFLNFISYFLDFIARYSDLAIFSIVTQLFLRFRPALLVKTNIKYLIYSAMKKDKCFRGVVYTQILSHSTVTQSFLNFINYFLDFVARYSDSAIF